MSSLLTITQPLLASEFDYVSLTSMNFIKNINSLAGSKPMYSDICHVVFVGARPTLDFHKGGRQ